MSVPTLSRAAAVNDHRGSTFTVQLLHPMPSSSPQLSGLAVRGTERVEVSRYSNRRQLAEFGGFPGLPATLAMARADLFQALAGHAAASGIEACRSGHRPGVWRYRGAGGVCGEVLQQQRAEAFAVVASRG